jgi:hypothetical protein
MRKNNFHNKITIKTQKFKREGGIEYLHTHPVFFFFFAFIRNIGLIL